MTSKQQVSAVEALKVLVEEIDASGVYLDRPADAVKFIAQCVSSALTKLIQREATPVETPVTRTPKELAYHDALYRIAHISYDRETVVQAAWDMKEIACDILGRGGLPVKAPVALHAVPDDAVAKALTELVRLKEIKDRWEAIPRTYTLNDPMRWEYERAERDHFSDYEPNKDKAWEAARAALKTTVPIPADLETTSDAETCPKHGVKLAFPGDECWACVEDAAT